MVLRLPGLQGSQMPVRPSRGRGDGPANCGLQARAEQNGAELWAGACGLPPQPVSWGVSPTRRPLRRAWGCTTEPAHTVPGRRTARAKARRRHPGTPHPGRTSRGSRKVLSTHRRVARQGHSPGPRRPGISLEVVIETCGQPRPPAPPEVKPHQLAHGHRKQRLVVGRAFQDVEVASGGSSGHRPFLEMCRVRTPSTAGLTPMARSAKTFCFGGGA